MRLVWSPFYQDVALSVYVKVKALAARPQGCEARTETIAGYLGLSPASVERGLTELYGAVPDGVAEVFSVRRTLPGGSGHSAMRRVREMAREEAFVILPVAAAEDLTPRQLRVYALIAYAQARGIAVTEAELAWHLRHHSGKRAGQALSVTAAAAVVDEVEAARWLTVQRRAGERGRNVYTAHDLAPEARPEALETAVEGPAEATEATVDGAADEVGSSQVGEGSGSPVGEGSLAYKEDHWIDSPENERGLGSPAAGEVQVGKAPEPVENPAGDESAAGVGEGGLALRAGVPSPSSPSTPTKRNSSSKPSPASQYTGPQLAMSAKIYAVLEPVHMLLAQVNTFVARKVAREVGRQLKAGTAPERLYYRLDTRMANTMTCDIGDAGRWLLGVALPRWGCGYQDCESGVIWRTGAACEICEEALQDKRAARQREERIAAGLCPEHGTRPNRSGRCTVCELDHVIAHPPTTTAVVTGDQPVLEAVPRGFCGDCGAHIVVIGPALEDGLCKHCRERTHSRAVIPAPAAAPAADTTPPTCSGGSAQEPCGRPALPERHVCARHRAQELLAEKVVA
ncbi:hypothetical protein C1N81_05195 (plasmid) [Streptomyces sp. SGAir0957]